MSRRKTAEAIAAGAFKFAEILPEEEEPTGLPHAIPAGDAEDDELPTYIVEQLLFESEVHAWVGRGGTGKSTAALAAAAAVAAGFAVFDRFPTRLSAPVLVVSEEDSAGLIRNRLEALCEGHGWPADEVLQRVHVLCYAQVKIDQAHWQAHLIEEAHRLNARVIILDPLFELTSGEENSNTEAKAYIGFLRRLAKETRAAVVVLHHVSKPQEGRAKRDRVRGAGALYDAARVVFFFDDDVRGIAVEPLKFSRAALPERFVLSRTVETDPENDAVWRSARLTHLTSDVAQELGSEKLVREKLAKSPGSMTKDLKAYAKGTGVSAIEVSQAIRNLENQGVISHEPGPQNAKFWSLREPADNSGQAGQANLPNLPEPAGQDGEAPSEPAPPFRGAGEAGADQVEDSEVDTIDRVLLGGVE